MLRASRGLKSSPEGIQSYEQQKVFFSIMICSVRRSVEKFRIGQKWYFYFELLVFGIFRAFSGDREKHGKCQKKKG